MGGASDDGTLCDGRSDAGGGAKSGSDVVRSMVSYCWRGFFVWRFSCDVSPPESVDPVTCTVVEFGLASGPF